MAGELPDLSPLIIAHRGARSLAPENTLAAARKALELGADMWELDVRMTADGELILIHDQTLRRTSDVRDVFPHRRPWWVHRFTLDEILRLDFGSWFNERDPFGQIAAGAVSDAEVNSYVGEPAPTLRQAISLTREHNWRLNIEIKDLRHSPDNVRTVRKVVALLEEENVVDRVLISSFNHGFLTEVKQRNPAIGTAALVSRAHPHPDSLLQNLGAQAYHPFVDAVKPEQIAWLRSRGFMVNVWTVNDPQTAYNLIQAGVSGIFTDFPQRLRPPLTDIQ